LENHETNAAVRPRRNVFDAVKVQVTNFSPLTAEPFLFYDCFFILFFGGRSKNFEIENAGTYAWSGTATQGQGCERAQLAYAGIVDGKIRYRVARGSFRNPTERASGREGDVEHVDCR